MLGLNSARSLTFGRRPLERRQIRRAAARLRGVDPELVKIIVTHHPFDLPDDYDAEHLVGRAKMAMAQLAEVGADLFLAGHLHVSHVGHTAERYKIDGHSALVVQAGTISDAAARRAELVQRPAGEPPRHQRGAPHLGRGAADLRRRHRADVPSRRRGVDGT